MATAYNIIRVWQTCFQLLCTICLEQLTVIYPISQQFQLIQIPSKNPSVCSSLTVTVLLPPSDRRASDSTILFDIVRVINHLYVCMYGNAQSQQQCRNVIYIFTYIFFLWFDLHYQ